MKKIKYLLFALMVIAMLPLGVFAKEKVNVYLFKREGCGYCANALTFLTNLSTDQEYQNYFNLVTKEVMNNKTNSVLMEEVAKHFGVDLKGVPFIIVGEQYFEGYANTFDEQIKEAIKNAYEQETQDVVASFGGQEKKSTSAATIIIVLAVIAGVAFLIYMAKDNTEKEEKIKESVMEEQKKETVVKKNVSSKPKRQTVKKSSTTIKKQSPKKKTTTKK